MDPEIERVRKLARVLDTYMVDPIIGLILPGAGDLIGSTFGSYIVFVALKRKVSPIVIARMLLNLGLDAAIGIIPLLGDLFDVAHKANHKNAALLADRANHGGKGTVRDWLAVAGAALLLLGVMALSIYAVYRLIAAIA